MLKTSDIPKLSKKSLPHGIILLNLIQWAPPPPPPPRHTHTKIGLMTQKASVHNFSHTKQQMIEVRLSFSPQPYSKQRNKNTDKVHCIIWVDIRWLKVDWTNFTSVQSYYMLLHQKTKTYKRFSKMNFYLVIFQYVWSAIYMFNSHIDCIMVTKSIT